MIEIDRLALDQRGRRDQLIGGARIKREVAFQQTVKLALLHVGWFAVDRDDVDQKRRRREAKARIVKTPIAMRGRRNNFGNELA